MGGGGGGGTFWRIKKICPLPRLNPVNSMSFKCKLVKFCSNYSCNIVMTCLETQLCLQTNKYFAKYCFSTFINIDIHKDKFIFLYLNSETLNNEYMGRIYQMSS